MTDSKPKQLPPYGIRIPPDLKARIQIEAERANRSLHSEIIHTLEEQYPAASAVEEAIRDMVHTFMDQDEEARSRALSEIRQGKGGAFDFAPPKLLGAIETQFAKLHEVKRAVAVRESLNPLDGGNKAAKKQSETPIEDGLKNLSDIVHKNSNSSDD